MHVVVVEQRELTPHRVPFGLAAAVSMVEGEDIPICVPTDSAPPSTQGLGDYVSFNLKPYAPMGPLRGLSSLSEGRIGPVTLEVVVLPA